jgi:hypothetical protein
VGSYHTELGVYAGLRSGDLRLRAGTDAALAALYSLCEVVLSPSESADGSLRALGVAPERIGRWDRGVDVARFDPRNREPSRLPGELTVLYAGRLTREKGANLLADAFLRARERDPRLHLALAGGGPGQTALRDRLGPYATFLGWLDSRELACAYASADVFLFASTTDTFGQVILEAQASGLPVVAVAEGGPALARRGRSYRTALPSRLRRSGRSRGRARSLAGTAEAAGGRRPRRGAGAHLGARARAARRGLPARARRGRERDGRPANRDRAGPDRDVGPCAP